MVRVPDADTPDSLAVITIEVWAAATPAVPEKLAELEP